MYLPSLTNFRVTSDNRGVVTVVLDMPGRAYNVFTEPVLAELLSIVDCLERDPATRLVIFRSGKKSGFLAGADLRAIAALPTCQSARQFVFAGQKAFDRLEALSQPTIAIIHGPCLGGGLEFALACRYRIGQDDDATRFGLPEVKLGLLSAWGGTQRLPQLIGLEAALPMLLTGRKVTPRQALEIGLVDEICPADRLDDGVNQFTAALLAEKTFDRQQLGCYACGRDRTKVEPQDPLNAMRRRLGRGRHRPALTAIISAIEQGLQRGRTAGLARECEVFPELLFSEFSRRRLARFFHRSHAKQRELWVAGLTIGAALRETARRFADRDALVFPQANVRMTWAEFDAAVDRVARGLLAIGLRRGDHFGVWSTNWPEWVLLQFACARVGVVLVTINPGYRAHELQYALMQSEIRGLALIERYRSSSYYELLREVCPELDTARPSHLHSAACPHLRSIVCIRGAEHPGMIAWKEFEAAGESIPGSLFENSQRALEANEAINLQYTSGTTGSPKGVLLSHRNLLLNAFYAAAGQRLTADDRICIPVPLYHCFGCVLGTMCATVSGAAMIFPRESFGAEATLRAIETERCTAIYGVPTMMIAELEHPNFRQTDTSSLRTGIMAGSPCPLELMKRVVHEMGASEITIAYGQTEASPLISMTRTDDPIEQRVGSVGRPLPGIEVKVVDVVTGEELPDGSAGELCSRGHDVMLGYFNMPEATAKAIDADGWLHTGDLAIRNPDGYIHITGRLKELIIRGGENVAPREIEDLLYEYPKVEQVAVVGVPDRRLGEEILAWIKLKAGESATVDEIRAFCRQHLAHFKTPHYIKFVDGFPTTVTGKIQKYKIRAQAIEELGLHEVKSIETA